MARSWDEDESVPLLLVLRALACVLTPWTAALLWWLAFPGRREVARTFPETAGGGRRVRQCQTSAMAAKRRGEIAYLRSRRRHCSVGLILRTSILAALWVWLVSVVRQYRAALAQNALYEGFEPYGLLRVEPGATEAELSRAFRREAFKYHPDKNSDPGAVEKFLLVRKAYDALTEPEAMSNFKEYGNPDGPQFVHLYAISSFIKDKDASIANGRLTYKKRMFRAADIQVHLLGVVLGLLGCLVLWRIPGPVSDEDALRDDGHRNGKEALVESLQRAVDVEGVARVLLTSTECRAWCAKRRQSHALAHLLDKLPTRPESAPTASEGEALLLAHLHRRHDLLDEALGKQLHQLLARWHGIARVLVTSAAEEAATKAVEAAIGLQRSILQALEPELVSSVMGELLQVPHFDEKVAKAWQEVHRKQPGLQGFLDSSSNERKAGLQHLGQQALADIEEFARVAPRLEIEKAVITAEGGGELRKGGSARLLVVLRRKNLTKCEVAGAVHAPLFPSASVPEAWWLLLELPGEPTPAACVRMANPGQCVQEELRFTVPAAGRCTCRFRVMCESYAGLDVGRQVSFTAR